MTQRAAKRVLDRLLSLPLPCSHPHVLHSSRPHPHSGGVREVEECSASRSSLSTPTKTFIRLHLQSGKSSAVDQTKQIEDLKKQLAVAQEKVKDFGTLLFMHPNLVLTVS